MSAVDFLELELRVFLGGPAREEVMSEDEEPAARGQISKPFRKSAFSCFPGIIPKLVAVLFAAIQIDELITILGTNHVADNQSTTRTDLSKLLGKVCPDGRLLIAIAPEFVEG